MVQILGQRVGFWKYKSTPKVKSVAICHAYWALKYFIVMLYDLTYDVVCLLFILLFILFRCPEVIISKAEHNFLLHSPTFFL
jgi:hypothetical protein